MYVFLGDLNGVVDLMTNLYDRGLLDTGEYIVIFVDHVTFDRTDTLKYFKRKLWNVMYMYNIHFVKITSASKTDNVLPRYVQPLSWISLISYFFDMIPGYPVLDYMVLLASLRWKKHLANCLVF